MSVYAFSALHCVFLQIRLVGSIIVCTKKMQHNAENACVNGMWQDVTCVDFSGGVIMFIFYTIACNPNFVNDLPIK